LAPPAYRIIEPAIIVAIRRCIVISADRHCEERSDEAIHSFFARRNGLLRFARNDD
jgi:hypothetical protein